MSETPDPHEPPHTLQAPEATAQAADAAAEGAPAPAEASASAALADAPAVPNKIADLSPTACAAALAERFPALFTLGQPLPIKLRVQADIQARAPGVFSKKSLSIFLHRHTTSTPYIRALLAAQNRFDLDGQVAGEIAPEHRAAATEELERRRQIVMARRASERAAMRAAPSNGPATTPASNQAEPAEPGLPVAPSRPRPQRHGRPSRPPSQQPRRAAPHPDPRSGAPLPAPHAAAHRPERKVERTADRAPQDSARPPEDPARRERQALLRAFESSPLSKANFGALKRLSEADLDAQLAQARAERDSR
jgi:ProP effector